VSNPFARSAALVDGIVEVRDPNLSTYVAATPWAVRYPLTISPIGDNPLYNFPLLVQLDEDRFDFTAALTDGSDIRFAATAEPNGADWLPMTLERFDSGAETAQFWVRVPEIKSVGDTTIYMFAGNPTPQDAPDTVFEHYEFCYHGDEGDGLLFPLTAGETGDRSCNSGRHFSQWPISEVREHSDPVDATGLTKANGTLIIEMKCSDPNQLYNSVPDDAYNTLTSTWEFTADDPEGFEWIGGIELSSTNLVSGGPIHAWWRQGIRDLGIQRQWHEHEITLADWINRSAELLAGEAATESDVADTAYDGTNIPNGNSSEIILGDGTSWNTDISPGDRVMIRFSRPENEKIFKVEGVSSDTKINVQGYNEDGVGDNVGVNFHGRSLWLVNADDEFEADQIQHVRIVGHFKSHNVTLYMRNARVWYDDASTNIVTDATGKYDIQRTLTSNGQVTTSGLIGSGFAFTQGSQGRFCISKQLDLGGRSLTLSAWFKAAADCVSIPLLGADDVNIRFETGLNLYLQWGKFRRDVAITTDLFDQQWHHIVFVRDRKGNAFRIYIDGELEATVDDAAPDCNVPYFTYIAGDDTAATTEDLSGTLDEVRLSYDVKSAGWVEAEYRTVSSNICTFGDVYESAQIPDGVELELADGGTLYVT
jgi:hypothetical protein